MNCNQTPKKRRGRGWNRRTLKCVVPVIPRPISRTAFFTSTSPSPFLTCLYLQCTVLCQMETVVFRLSLSKRIVWTNLKEEEQKGNAISLFPRGRSFSILGFPKTTSTMSSLGQRWCSALLWFVTDAWGMSTTHARKFPLNSSCNLCRGLSWDTKLPF